MNNARLHNAMKVCVGTVGAIMNMTAICEGAILNAIVGRYLLSGFDWVHWIRRNTLRLVKVRSLTFPYRCVSSRLYLC